MNIPSLDGIRAIAIAIVLVAHAGYGLIVPGGLGVTVFFFLSGYLITTLLLAEHAQHGAINIRYFYVRRIFRLAPTMVIALVLAYALTMTGLLPGATSWTGFFAQLLYFANYYSIYSGSTVVIPQGTDILWSLAVEEHFYLVYPVMLAVLLKLTSIKNAGAILLAICALSLVWRYVLTTETGFDVNRIYLATDTRFDSILYGCILALWRNPMNGNVPRKISSIHGLALLAAGGSGLLFTLIYRDAQFRETLRYSLQGLALMPIFYAAITANRLPLFTILNAAPLRKIGDYSYAIYLSHFVIINLVHTHAPAIGNSPLLLLLVAFAGSIIFSILMDKMIEPYFRTLRSRFSAHKRTKSPIASAA